MLVDLKARGWTSEELALRIADILYGRSITPVIDTPPGHEHARWNIAPSNNVWLHETGEPCTWKLSFRYGAPAGFLALLPYAGITVTSGVEWPPEWTGKTWEVEDYVLESKNWVRVKQTLSEHDLLRVYGAIPTQSTPGTSRSVAAAIAHTLGVSGTSSAVAAKAVALLKSKKLIEYAAPPDGGPKRWQRTP